MKRRRWMRDLAPVGRSFPETGLGRGWEPPVIMALTVILLLFGLLTLYSASGVMAQRAGLPHYHYVARQATGAVLGLLAMIAFARIPTKWWRHLDVPVLVTALALLLIVILPFTHAIAPEINGARRWLRMGINLQPSDVAKLAAIVWTASAAVRKQPHFKSLRNGLGPFVVVWGLILLLTALEPDLSTACLIGALGAVMAFHAGARLAHFAFLGLLAAPGAALLLRSGYRESRWEAVLLDPGVPPTGSAFQSYQSLIAIGSGGVKGVGFGQGRQKFGFLPEAHNDFIFALIGEEWGLLGVVIVVGLFLAFIAVGFRIARRAKDLFGELLAVGVTTLIGLQAFLHIGVGLGIFPPTGLSLPFFSYGRSNMLVLMAAVGILLAVAREAPEGRSGRAGARTA